jgi:hypothetical protein
MFKDLVLRTGRYIMMHCSTAALIGSNTTTSAGSRNEVIAGVRNGLFGAASHSFAAY